MFRQDQVGKVNREAVGAYAAGTLLVVAPDAGRHRRIPWDRVLHPDGVYVLALDANDNPLFPPTDVGADQLAGVTVEPDPRGPGRRPARRELNARDRPVR